jgi:anti-sigma factor RsiW
MRPVKGYTQKREAIGAMGTARLHSPTTRMYERLPCARVESGITDFLEGALPARAQRRFEAHLRSCRNCRTQLQRMRWTIDLLSKLSGEAMPAWMKLRLDPQLRSTLRSPPSSLHRRSSTSLSRRAPDL